MFGEIVGVGTRQSKSKKGEALCSLDFRAEKDYNQDNFINHSSAVCFGQKQAENSESGENPGRYRHCKRGGAAQDESQPLGLTREGRAATVDPQVRRPA